MCIICVNQPTIRYRMCMMRTCNFILPSSGVVISLQIFLLNLNKKFTMQWHWETMIPQGVSMISIPRKYWSLFIPFVSNVVTIRLHFLAKCSPLILTWSIIYKRMNLLACMGSCPTWTCESQCCVHTILDLSTMPLVLAWG